MTGAIALFAVLLSGKCRIEIRIWTVEHHGQEALDAIGSLIPVPFDIALS